MKTIIFLCVREFFPICFNYANSFVPLKDKQCYFSFIINIQDIFQIQDFSFNYFTFTLIFVLLVKVTWLVNHKFNITIKYSYIIAYGKNGNDVITCCIENICYYFSISF